MSMVVDAGSAQTISIYLDGKLASTTKTPKASKDGQFTLRRQLALLQALVGAQQR